MAICLAQNSPDTFHSDNPSNEVFVATARGVVTIHRTGSGGWTVTNRSLEGHHISCLMIEPSKKYIFAGVHNGPLYVSKDSAKTWKESNQGITEKHIFCLNYANRGGKIKLYAGTEPARLFVSDDLGETWREFSSLRSVPSVDQWDFPAPPNQAHLKNVVFDPKDEHTLYACIEQGALLRSRDEGVSWEELHGFHLDAHRLLIRPSDPNWFYVTGGDGLYHSKDAGKTWEHLTTKSDRIGYPDSLFMHPENENLMFMSGSRTSPFQWRKNGTADAGILRSYDAGRTWHELKNGLPNHLRGNIEAMLVEFWNGSVSFLAGTTDGEIFCSDDGGEHWTTAVAGIPPISKGRHYQLLEGQGAH